MKNSNAGYFNEDLKCLTAQIDSKNPFTFIDVGAMGGIPLKWNAIREDMQIIAFEPDTRAFCKLENSQNTKYLNCALYDKSEDLKFYITKVPSKSSMFEPNMSLLSQFVDSQRFQVIEETIIPASRVKTLDSIFEENSIEDVDFIKVDTDGSELFVLRGGSKNVLPKTFGVQVEVEFVEMHHNNPLFRDVDEFMHSRGFCLIDLKRQYWKRKDHYDYQGKGQLIFGDALYFKKIDVFINELAALQDNLYAKSKIMKSIIISIIYKMFDYAVAIAKAGCDLGFLSDNEFQNIITKIKSYSKRKSPPKFYLKRRIFNFLYSILQKLKPPSLPDSIGLWANSDDEIGNIVDL